MCQFPLPFNEVALAILSRLGFRADAVANGQEAIQSLSTIPYDVVLMDCQMPVMDGYAATKLIRDTSSSVLNHRVPVIATTANAMKGDREICLAAGMDDYISKPVSPKILAAGAVEIGALFRRVADLQRGGQQGLR